MILALAGGVGGARFAHGLAQIVPVDALTVVVNTADDFEHLGFCISPDLDTVMYTLAKRANDATGWGLAGETWKFMSALERLGGAAWFRLGDQDLATHAHRTSLLAEGLRLSEVTARLCQALGVMHRVVPMSDDRVRTIVHTAEGALAFQDYFVRRGCAPVVRALEYEGARLATPTPAIFAADLELVIVCPSNPWLSIDPILALPGVRDHLQTRRVPVVAISPIIGGKALKGPTDKIMRELGIEPSVTEIARHYAGLIDGLVVDVADTAHAQRLACEPLVTQAVMHDAADRARLAREVIEFARNLTARKSAHAHF